MDDTKTNPWPAIRELQDIVRDLNSDIKELRGRIEVLEEFVQKQEGK